MIFNFSAFSNVRRKPGCLTATTDLIVKMESGVVAAQQQVSELYCERK